MHKIVILFGKWKWENAKYPKEGEYRECYEYLYNLAREYSIEMYRASYQWFNEKNGVFTHAQTFDGKSWQNVSNLKPDLIYDKSNFAPDKIKVKASIASVCPIVDHPDFSQLVANKIYTNILFTKWSIPSKVVTSTAEVSEALKDLPGDRAVLKPADSFGGKGIIIDSKERLAQVKVIQTMLLQQFIETSGGIPGVTEGRHDLRVVVVGERPVQAYIRIPAAGKFLANEMQGGSEHMIRLEQIPESAHEVLTFARESFRVFPPVIYAVDFMFARGGKRVYVVELNDTPGIYYQRQNYQYRDAYYRPMLELFRIYLASL